MKKSYILLVIASCIFQFSTKVFAIDDPVALQFFDLTSKVINQGFEEPNQAYSLRPDGKKGIIGWAGNGVLGIDTVIVDDTQAKVFQGVRSLKVETKGVKNNGLEPYSASIMSDTISVDTLGRYMLSFWTKADTIKTDGAWGNAYWITVEAYDKDGVYLSDKVCESSYNGFPWASTHTRWERVLVPMSITNTAIKYVKLIVQCNYSRNKYWFDNVMFHRFNPKVQQNLLIDFNTGQIPVNISSVNIGAPSIDNTSNSLRFSVPDPEIPSSYRSNLGWGQQVAMTTNLKPVSPLNWIFKFRTRFANGPANLFAWDGTTNKRMPQTDQNRGVFAMQVKLWKTGNIELGNTIIHVNVVDDKWMLVQADITAAAANLVGDEVIEKITISCGIPGELYYGDWLIDDLRFGFPPMVKLSSISKTELAAGWELKVNPTRDCKLYLVPQGTEITEVNMDAAVTAGTGFKFENLIGAFENLIPTSNLNSTANPKNFLAVAYRNAEDLSNGDLITVYPPHNTAKYTAYHISSYPGATPPQADGLDTDAIWTKVPEKDKIEIVNETALKPYNPADYKATFKAVYDNDNIYFLVEVDEPKDSLVNFGVQPGDPTNEVKPWMSDAVEFLFRKDSEPKGYIQALLGHGKSVFEGQTMLINNMTYLDQNTMGNIPTGNKYFFEVVFPLNEIGFTTAPVEGSILNAELAVFNNNQGYKKPSNYKLVWDGPVFQKVWMPGGIHWGEITLSRQPAPTAVKSLSVTSLSVSPNPVQNTLKISGVDNIERIQVYTLAGIFVKNFDGALSNLSTVDVSDLQSGIYMLKVVADKQVGYSRFIKK